MSDVNATPAEVIPEAPATAVVTPEVAPVAPVAPVVGVTSTAEPAVDHHESLLTRIEGLPADGVALLHDVLAHVTEGVDEFALTIGLGRLKSLFEKVKSRL